MTKNTKNSDSSANNIDDLSKLLEGDVLSDDETRTSYSYDASLFEIRPEMVVFPKNSQDVCRLVQYVAKNKAAQPGLSLTGRSAGTDMSGGAINDSIVVAFEKYFKKMSLTDDDQAVVQPGVFYRDLEKKTLAKNLLMPSYPASKDLCMVGGIVNNNSGGEKSLQYGKTKDYVTELKVVLRDGKEHTVRPLNKKQLEAKLKGNDIESQIYRDIYNLVDKNKTLIDRSIPIVTKNSTAYNVWDVWDGETFDLSKLIVGGQGTLGLVTEAKMKLVPYVPLSGMLVAFLPGLKDIAKIVKELLPLKPDSLESFDEHTLKFAIRFFFSFRKTLGWKKFIILGLSFIPLLGKLMNFLPNLPKLILLIEFEGHTQEEIDGLIKKAQEVLAPYNIKSHVAPDRRSEEKFWQMRRESFNLLRNNVKNKHTAPFIDDLIVPVDTLADFLPPLIEIMERYKLLYTIAGHVGDGNFHIIPLMDLSDESERAKIPAVLEEVTALVVKHKGSLSGEHNDGLIRGPFLPQMYSPEMMKIFREIKHIFDPDGIFNPNKKTTATWKYAKEHIRRRF